jgi:hypothetical protein
MHNNTRGMSTSQKGLQVRFRENVRFGPFSWVVAHSFQHKGQFFLQHPGCAQTPSRRHLARFSLIFGLLGTRFRPFFDPFRCLWNRELLAQTEDRMMHFVTLMVPPRIDNSLMHNSTRGMSSGQKGLQVCFRENVCFRPFSWVIAHDFQDAGQFFYNIPDVHRLLLQDIWRGFH